MKSEKKGGAKAPRKHNPTWKDTTRTARGSKRTAQLNAIAQAAGWKGISEYLTAIINGRVRVVVKSHDSVT